MQEFDIVVIGAGPGGYVCAIRAAQLHIDDLERLSALRYVYCTLFFTLGGASVARHVNKNSSE